MCFIIELREILQCFLILPVRWPVQSKATVHSDYIQGKHSLLREQYGDDASAFKTFNQARIAALNSVIRHLNMLNELTEKYDTTRFTPRDFWTSERRGRTQEIEKRLRYDSKAVEAYCSVAFSDEIAEDERRHRGDDKS